MYMQAAGITIIALILFVRPVAAQDITAPLAQASEGTASVSKKNGTVAAAGKTVTRGTITNVNTERREFTVKRKSGEEVVVPAGPEVKNFDQIKVGDQIVLREAESIILGLRKAEKGKALVQRSEADTVNVAKPGDKPGIAATRETHIVADVTAVNKKTGKITLKGPNQTRTFQLRDPSLLANIKKGDQIEAVVLEGEALSVEAANTP